MTEEFRSLKTELDGLEERMQELDQLCTGSLQILQESRIQTRDFLEAAKRLQVQQRSVQRQKEISEAFLERFSLKKEEIEALEGTEGSTDLSLFSFMIMILSNG